MTIEIPVPSAELLSQLETASIEVSESEQSAVAALREKFTPYAKHNGTIKIGDYDKSTSNYRVDRAAYYEIDGKRVKALLAKDAFSYDHSDQYRGSQFGSKLYLTESGEWLEITRVGHWTQWQGEAQWWYCGNDAASEIFPSDEDYDGGESHTGGSIRTMSDAEVAGEYVFESVVKQLGESMAELCKKLPARYAKLQARAELAKRTLEAISAKS